MPSPKTLKPETKDNLFFVLNHALQTAVGDIRVKYIKSGCEIFFPEGCIITYIKCNKAETEFMEKWIEDHCIKSTAGQIN